jgi:hypothetical protein
MTRKLIIIATLLAVGLLAVPAWSKRRPPPTVAPVTRDGIEYSAPRDRMGFVIATWIKTQQEIWSRQIYVVKHEYRFGLETDIQDCFITSLRFADGKLLVTNERGGEFALDPVSLEVKVLKGRLVIDYTGFTPSAP